MLRKAFVLQLLPGHEAEYQRRHDEIWPDMVAMLKRHGVHHYVIFLDPETLQLFGSLEIEDEVRFAAVPGTEECLRWWKYMDDIMVYHPDGTPKARELREVFYLN